MYPSHTTHWAGNEENMPPSSTLSSSTLVNKENLLPSTNSGVSQVLKNGVVLKQHVPLVPIEKRASFNAAQFAQQLLKPLPPLTTNSVNMNNNASSASSVATNATSSLMTATNNPAGLMTSRVRVPLGELTNSRPSSANSSANILKDNSNKSDVTKDVSSSNTSAQLVHAGSVSLLPASQLTNAQYPSHSLSNTQANISTNAQRTSRSNSISVAPANNIANNTVTGNNNNNTNNATNINMPPLHRAASNSFNDNSANTLPSTFANMSLMSSSSSTSSISSTSSTSSLSSTSVSLSSTASSSHVSSAFANVTSFSSSMLSSFVANSSVSSLSAMQEREKEREKQQQQSSQPMSIIPSSASSSSASASSPLSQVGHEVPEDYEGFLSVVGQDRPLFGHLYVSDYEDDIFQYLFQAEERHRLQDTNYMEKQPDLNGRMREILVDWIIEVTGRFRLHMETLFLCINVIDRFLEKRQVSRKKLQLVGCSACLVAAKYEEIYVPEVNDFVTISDHAYTREMILGMESMVLTSLNFNFTVPSSLRFLDHYIGRLFGGFDLTVAPPSYSQSTNAVVEKHEHRKRMRLLAIYLCHVALQNYQMLKFKYSQVAAAALYLSMNTFRMNWTAEHDNLVQYSLSSLRDCIFTLYDSWLPFYPVDPNHPPTFTIPESKCKAVMRKFLKPRYGVVASIVVPKPDL